MTSSLVVGSPFGPQPLGPGVSPVTFDGAAGRLTGLLATPTTPVRAEVLLVPGFTGSKEDFLPVLSLLAEAGYRVLAFSQRGQADAENAGSYTLTDFADDLFAAADAAGMKRPHVLGHSFGGVVGRAGVVRSPGRFASLTALCSGPRPIPASQESEQSLLALRAFGGMVVFRGQYPDLLDEPQSDPFIEMQRLRAAQNDTEQLLAVADLLGTFPDITAELKASGVPVLLLGGANDFVWPQTYSDQEAKMLGIPMHRIPDAGHSAQQDQPEAVVQALTTFWGNLD